MKKISALLSRYPNYSVAVCLSLAAAFIIAVISFTKGNIPFFLWLNNDLGNVGDTCFAFITHLGEEAPWIVALVLFVLYRKKYLPLLIFSFLFSTFIAQGIKRLLPEQPRPTKAIVDKRNEIHTVEGVDLHTVASFPSGHTTTAFTIFLLACMMIASKWVISMGFIYALAVGYSRIYLAQHFPRDVAGGIVAGVLATFIALLLQYAIWGTTTKEWNKKKAA